MRPQLCYNVGVKLWWQDQEDVEYQVGRSAFYAFTDSIVDTQSAIKVLAITVTAEIGLLAFIYVNRAEAFKFLDDGEYNWFYAAIGAFLIGFLTAFAVFRFVPRNFKQIFFAYTVWIVSIVCGVANIALFYLLLSFRMQ
jgi:hypothetical protein